MRLPDPEKNRLDDRHTLEVTPRDGAVWLEISHGLTVSVTALRPSEASGIAQALHVAAVKAAEQASEKGCA